jgi:hypothetical protein
VLFRSTGRKYLTFEDGTRSYFPGRVPKTVKFKIDDCNAADQYARLYAPPVVDTINALSPPYNPPASRGRQESRSIRSGETYLSVLRQFPASGKTLNQPSDGVRYACQTRK